MTIIDCTRMQSWKGPTPVFCVPLVRICSVAVNGVDSFNIPVIVSGLDVFGNKGIGGAMPVSLTAN